MKKILYYLNAVLDEAIKEMKNKLFMPLPAVAVAAIISGATTIGTKIAADRKAAKLTARADKQAEEERIKNERQAKEAVQIARGTAREGDPTLALKQRQIKETAATAVGKAVATSGSSQEIINAAQTVQGNVDKANLAAQSQAGQFRIDLRNQLASRFSEAGRLRLAGQVGIDRRLQGAVDAIGASAQSAVDTTQNVGKLLVDTLAFTKGIKTQEI